MNRSWRGEEKRREKGSSILSATTEEEEEACKVPITKLSRQALALPDRDMCTLFR